MSKRVLVADDSAMMRKMIIKQLQPPEYVITGQAKNGTDAVELYKKLNPDIVTLDISMPEMGGIAAAKEIFDFDKSACIVFLYNFPDESLLEDAPKIGVRGVASKHKAKELLNTL
jgi:two-component system, chemotaxis family, chemotaxis protein CheY